MNKTREARIMGVIDFIRSDNSPDLNMELYYSIHGRPYDEDTMPMRSITRRIETGNWCGTAACIAGYAYILALRDGFTVKGLSVEVVAVRYLGISKEKKAGLFYDYRNPGSVDYAVAKLQALLT